MSDWLTRILLVEDNVGDARLLQVVLDEDRRPLPRYEIVVVASLAAAAEYLGRESFDVALLDLSLPDAFGLQSVVSLRNIAPNLPIVVLTSLDDEAVGLDAVRHGAQDYLIKGQADHVMLTRAMGYAIERKQIEMKLDQQRKRQTVLYETHLSLTSTLDLASVANLLLDKITAVMPHSVVGIRLLDAGTNDLVPIACRGLDDTDWKKTHYTSDAGVALVVAARQLIVWPDIHTARAAASLDFFRRHGLMSYLGIPLLVGGEVLGVLSFYGKAPHEFTDEELSFLCAFAGQSAMAIQNSMLYEEVKRSQRQLQGFSARLLSAREEERVWIAREIHDQLGQALSLVRIDLVHLGRKLPGLPNDLAQLLADACKTVDDTIDIVRRVSMELRPALLNTLGLALAIESRLKEFEHTTGVRCTLISDVHDHSLGQAVSIGLFRIVQESLTNVARHAKAQSVRVVLRRSDRELLLEVSDDGCGIDPSETSAVNSIGLGKV